MSSYSECTLSHLWNTRHSRDIEVWKKNNLESKKRNRQMSGAWGKKLKPHLSSIDLTSAINRRIDKHLWEVVAKNLCGDLPIPM